MKTYILFENEDTVVVAGKAPAIEVLCRTFYDNPEILGIYPVFAEFPKFNKDRVYEIHIDLKESMFSSYREWSVARHSVTNYY